MSVCVCVRTKSSYCMVSPESNSMALILQYYSAIFMEVANLWLSLGHTNKLQCHILLIFKLLNAFLALFSSSSISALVDKQIKKVIIFKIWISPTKKNRSEKLFGSFHFCVRSLKLPTILNSCQNITFVLICLK